MADNIGVVSGASTFTAAADEATYSGDTTKVQLTRLVHVTGSEGSKTIQEIAGNSTPAADAYGLTHRRPVVSTAHLVTAGSGDATSIKASAGTLKSVHVLNVNTVPIYVKFHDTAGVPTPGTGVVLSVGAQAGLPRDFPLPDGGRAFTTGIGMTVVTGIADDDATGVSLNDASIEVCYV